MRHNWRRTPDFVVLYEMGCTGGSWQAISLVSQKPALALLSRQLYKWDLAVAQRGGTGARGRGMWCAA